MKSLEEVMLDVRVESLEHKIEILHNDLLRMIELVERILEVIQN